MGGCCGVGPAHIRAMARAIEDLKPVRSKPVIQWMAEPVAPPEKRPIETSILDLMTRGQTVVVTELDPPKTLDLEKYFAGAQRLPLTPEATRLRSPTIHWPFFVSAIWPLGRF